MYLKDDGTLDHHGLARDLRGIVCDRPARDPHAVLSWLAARLAADPAGRDGPALTLGLYATSCYTIWRVRRVAVVDALIEAAGRARAVYGALGCPAPGAHRHPEIGSVDDHETIAGLVGAIGDRNAWRSLDGRRALDECGSLDGRRTWGGAASGGPPGEYDGWRCPAFLAGLACNTLTTLRNGRKARFEAPETADLDAYFLTEGSRTDIERLTLTVERHRPCGPNDLAEQAAVWAARRLISGAADAADAAATGSEGHRFDERAALLLTVCFAAQHCYWCATPPAMVSVYRDALATVDLDYLNRPCLHPGGHPDVPLRTLLRYVRVLSGYGSDDSDVAEDVWRCPRHMAERASRTLAYTAEYLGVGGPRY